MCMSPDPSPYWGSSTCRDAVPPFCCAPSPCLQGCCLGAESGMQTYLCGAAVTEPAETDFQKFIKGFFLKAAQMVERAEVAKHDLPLLNGWY